MSIPPLIALLTAALLSCQAAAAAELSATERRWLHGVWPVVVFAKQALLPLDIVVQPQATPGAAPLALGFVDGRCKLVLSMRGNPQAQQTLENIAPELLDATLELMAAHELGHCRRYLDGGWYGMPAGFVASMPSGLDPTQREAYLSMRLARREEGYGDLVGLAWIQQQRPQLYARMHAWLLAERLHDLQPGSHHDTQAWIRLAADPKPTTELTGTSIFATAAALWATGPSD